MSDQHDDNDEAAESLIPETPDAETYEEEAKAQAVFGAEDDQGDVFGEEDDPLALFQDWLKLAGEHELNDPNAMCVASVDETGLPDARMVLLKELDQGFTFYTNMNSTKGEQLKRNPQCALLFHWKSIRRQVRIRGQAKVISEETADEYFARRDRGSRIGAWASQQSRDMSEPEILKQRISDYEDIFDGKDVPRPDFWRGFRVIPTSMEFWVNRPFRLHDRRLFEKSGETWTVKALYP